jgi:acetate---CoA ligase (ADP-forming) subunit beta
MVTLNKGIHLMNRDSAIRIINNALKEGRNILSEYESKLVLAAYDIPVTREILLTNKTEVQKAAHAIGYPLVMKGCSAAVAHKTEKGLIHVDIRTLEEAQNAFDKIMAALKGFDGAVLMQEMVYGKRELVMGMTRDDQFGPCVMFGLGGIFTEILRDIVFRKAPLSKNDAWKMMREIKGYKILDAIRGMAAADTELLSHILINVGRIGLEIERVQEIDLNPVILSGAKPVVVDALIVLK